MNREQSKAVEPAAVPVPESGAAGAPDLAELFELGLEHFKARRLPEAETTLRQVLAGLKATPANDRSSERPFRLKVLNALGRTLDRQGRYAEAIDCYERALAVDSGNALVYNNLGNSLKKANEFDAAIACLERAVALAPKEPRFRFNLGHALSDRGRLSDALVQYDTAREIDPGFTEAGLNRSFTLLRLGDYANGFPAYEKRWSLPGRGLKKPDAPEWAGESYRGRRLLVYAEQGQGDMIMCLRYLPLAKERGGELLVECWPPLRRLVERVLGVDRLWARGEERPAFDLACPIMSLPRWFTTDVASIPGTVPYLTTPPGLGAKFEPFLARAEGRLKVGLAWAGNAKNKADHERSLRLAALLGHFALPGVALYSLQKGPPEIELKTVAPDAPIIDLAPHLNDFADTAAAIEGLDLVITVDTAVAHLAGALARPAWVILSHVCYWPWLAEVDSSPWYPTMRLFRQPAPCEWGPVLRAVRDELARVAAGDRVRLLPASRG